MAVDVPGQALSQCEVVLDQSSIAGAPVLLSAAQMGRARKGHVCDEVGL